MSEKSVMMSGEEVLSIISRFFPLEWKNLKPADISLTRPQSGANNEVYFVSRLVPGHEEPDKLLLRKFSSISAGHEAKDKKPAGGMRATPLEQMVMMTELADRGLGPKVLGVFEDGRLEELIDCHMISLDEARDPLIEADIATNLARIHATSVPLPKPGYMFSDALTSLIHDLKDLFSAFHEIGDQSLIQAVNHDFESDLKMMQPLLQLEENRVVLMNWDPHLDNIAIRHNVTGDQLKTIIFDFENASCNIRAKDLGLFLVSRSGFFPFVREDRRLETEDEFRSFLKAYQKEVVVQFKDADVTGKESMEHLMTESLTGGILSCISFFLLIAIVVGKKKGVACDSMIKLLPVLIQGIEACKSALAAR